LTQLLETIRSQLDKLQLNLADQVYEVQAKEKAENKPAQTSFDAKRQSVRNENVYQTDFPM
jgi:hypothetical protein